ncbi:MAG: MORN repeat-containing protein [Rhodoferax sp.]
MQPHTPYQRALALVLPLTWLLAQPAMAQKPLAQATAEAEVLLAPAVGGAFQNWASPGAAPATPAPAAAVPSEASNPSAAAPDAASNAPAATPAVAPVAPLEAPPPAAPPPPPPPPPPPEGCRPLTERATALDLKAATAQSQKRDLAEQVKWVEEAVLLWTKAVEQCEGRARERAQRNLADDLKMQARLNEQQGAGPQCEAAHKDAAAMQDLARQALSERRFGEASVLFHKAEDAWDNASELCTGSQQEVANRRREQSEIDGHNAEHCAPRFEQAREQTQKLRTLAAATPREEKQELSQIAETLWRDALTQCKGAVLDAVRNQIQTIARERATPWVARALPAAPAAPVAASATVAKAQTDRNTSAISAGSASQARSGTPREPGAASAASAASTANKPVGAALASGSKAAATSAPSLAAALSPAVSLPISSAAPSAAPGASAPAATPQAQPQPPDFMAGSTHFIGQFVRDADSPTYSGSGKLIWSNGDTFEGSLSRSERHGKGRFVWANGQSYDGDWEHDKPDGQASMRFVNGNQYVGAVTGGRPHGSGRMTYASGDSYVGQFQAGVPHGQGVYTWKNGQQYDGQWQNDQALGQGTLRFVNGNLYEGSVVNGNPNGQGRTVFASGETYTGQIVNGLPEGQGSFIWTNGDQYTGQWKAGKKHGQGVFAWKSGERWEGVYDNDQRVEKPGDAK